MPNNSYHNNNNNNNSLDGGDTTSVGYSSAGDMESESFLPQHDDGGSLGTAQMLNDPHYYNTSHRNNPHRNRNHHGGGADNGDDEDDEDDATSVVHEMHLALLYLLSNPEEFQRALATRPMRGATTLHEWNAEYEDAESLAGETTTTDATNSLNDGSLMNRSSSSSSLSSTPLPFVVFADDAEVVLPAAHTASQLFGVEKVTGMELEAAAGVPALSQLFLRWLALMPGGDHLNLIDPPGLTVMRIAGGRYRVTAAHRVVWMWMNDFPNMQSWEDDANNNDSTLLYDDSAYHNVLDEDISLQKSNSYSKSPRCGGGGGGGGSRSYSSNSSSSRNRNDFNREGVLRPGDLVTLTIVDVFETDNQGKLLSYCPTFDNRMVLRTNATTETLRKSTAHLTKLISKVQKSTLAKKISFHATQIATALRERVEEAVSGNKMSPLGKSAGSSSLSLSSSSPSPPSNHNHGRIMSMMGGSKKTLTTKTTTATTSTSSSTTNSKKKNPVLEEKKDSSNHSVSSPSIGGSISSRRTKKPDATTAPLTTREV
ncbi:hypothetical protein ACA910_011277 [Epithemia clementina (nom. ined.)]